MLEGGLAAGWLLPWLHLPFPCWNPLPRSSKKPSFPCCKAMNGRRGAAPTCYCCIPSMHGPTAALHAPLQKMLLDQHQQHPLSLPGLSASHAATQRSLEIERRRDSRVGANSVTEFLPPSNHRPRNHEVRLRSELISTPTCKHPPGERTRPLRCKRGKCGKGGANASPEELVEAERAGRGG